MVRKTDKELVLEVYELYVSSETYSEYNDKLNELSLQTNKTLRYMKDLIEEYKKIFSKEQLKNIELTKKRHLEFRKNNNYQQLVQRLSQMSDEEMKEYLSGKLFSDVKISFNKFFDKIEDQELLKVARDTLKRIKDIYDQNTQEKSIRKAEEDYKLAVQLFDVMINDGLFDFVDFRRRYFSKFNMSEDRFYYYIDKYKKLLINKFPDKYSYYMTNINRNKLKFIFEHASSIQDMLNRIPERYDIVDYYININLSIDIFRKLCSEFLDSNQIVSLNKFFDKYFDLMNNSIKDIYSLSIPTYTSINQFVLTEEMEKQILDFMEKYGIPRNFFIVCVDKYQKGQLDDYLNINKKSPNI